MKRLNVNFSTAEEHLLLKQVKLFAVESEQQIRDVVIAALQEYLDRLDQTLDASTREIGARHERTTKAA